MPSPGGGSNYTILRSPKDVESVGRVPSPGGDSNGANLIAVRLDNPANSSRWYPGGGLYRHVWLVTTLPVHVAHWGVFVQTPAVSSNVAKVVVETTVDNQSALAADVVVRQELLAPWDENLSTRLDFGDAYPTGRAQADVGKLQVAGCKLTERVAIQPATFNLQPGTGSGAVLASGEATLSGVPANGSGRAVTKLRVKAPRLWDVTSPRLHTMRTIVFVGGKEVDRVETPFGIRGIAWSADKGFLLNDRVLKLRGVCNHHDLGALGAAFNLRAAERQLELLREMGCNAIRTAHNPPAPQLLDLCDRMGFVVMDELFDCWKLSKTPGDYAADFDAWHERDVANFVRRDRNHPSVILWSSGNEIREQAKEAGNHDRARRLTALFHREDPTRKVACGMNNAESITNGFAQTVDVAGYNYKAITAKTPNYLDHIRHAPGQPFFGAETASTVSSRGVYFFPVSERKGGGFFQFQVSSYDLFAPGWGNIPDRDFDSADQLPALAGEFVWTGFDYLGEPTPYNKDDSNLLNFQNEAERAALKAEMARLGGRVPSRSSYFGIFDLAGFPKDRYYLYQARWRPDLPMAHILPHWNWPERVGQATPVHIYTSGDEAELFLNGKSLGRKKKGAGAGSRLQVESCRLDCNALGQLATCNLQLATSSLEVRRREAAGVPQGGREYRLRWNDVQYEPGELKAVVWKNGKPWATAVRRTTGEAAALRLVADRNTIHADGSDLSFVTVQVADARGDVVPAASQLVKFSVSGPGEIAGVDNGNAASLLPLQGREMNAFSGQCLVIVRSRPGQPGEIELTATAEGLPAATARIHSVLLQPQIQ